MRAVDFKLLWMYFIFSMFQETGNSVLSMRWKLSSLLCQADGETLLLKKCIFALKKEKKKFFRCVVTLQVMKATVVAFTKYWSCCR